MASPTAPLHLGSSRHPVAADAVADLVVQLLESLGFSRPLSVLHLAIVGDHAMHGEAIVSAVGNLLQPQLVTAQVHASDVDQPAPALLAAGFATGLATLVPGASEAFHGDGEHRFTVGKSFHTKDSVPVAMSWAADRLYRWDAAQGLTDSHHLHIEFDPEILRWDVPAAAAGGACGGPRINTPWYTPTWRRGRIVALDDRPAALVATECMERLLDHAENLQARAVEHRSADDASATESVETYDPSDLTLWTSWPSTDLPAPYDRLTSLSMVTGINRVTGELRVDPAVSVDTSRNDAVPVQLIAALDPSLLRSAGPLSQVVSFAQRSGGELEGSLPWPAPELAAQFDGAEPRRMTGAIWRLGGRQRFEMTADA